MKKIMLIDGGPRRNMNTAAMAEAKKAWRDAHWEEDLRKAREAGKRVANTTTRWISFCLVEPRLRP